MKRSDMTVISWNHRLATQFTDTADTLGNFGILEHLRTLGMIRDMVSHFAPSIDINKSWKINGYQKNINDPSYQIDSLWMPLVIEHIFHIAIEHKAIDFVDYRWFTLWLFNIDMENGP